MADGRSNFEQPAKKSRFAIAALINTGAEHEDTIENLLREINTLIQKQLPVHEWPVLLDHLLAIKSPDDLKLVVSSIPIMHRKPFLDRYIAFINPFIFNKSEGRLACPVLHLLLPSQREAFMNAYLGYGVSNLSDLLLLANHPDSINIFSQPYEFFRIIHENHLRQFITNAADLITLLQKCPAEEHVYILKRLGDEKIRSLFKNIEDLRIILKISSFRHCLEMVDRNVICALLRQEVEFSAFVLTICERLRLPFIQWMNEDMLNEFIPDHVRLQTILRYLPERGPDKALEHIAKSALTKSVASLRRYAGDLKLFLTLITLVMEQLRPKNPDRNRAFSAHDLHTHQSINLLLGSLRLYSTSTTQSVDIHREKMTGPLAEVYQTLVRPYLAYRDEKRKAMLKAAASSVQPPSSAANK